MVVIAEATLKSILIYPDFLNSQSNFIRVSDVSNTQLKHVRVNINKNELYTFSSDGILFAYRRIYQSFCFIQPQINFKALSLNFRSYNDCQFS